MGTVTHVRRNRWVHEGIVIACVVTILVLDLIPVLMGGFLAIVSIVYFYLTLIDHGWNAILMIIAAMLSVLGVGRGLVFLGYWWMFKITDFFDFLEDRMTS